MVADLTLLDEQKIPVATAEKAVAELLDLRGQLIEVRLGLAPLLAGPGNLVIQDLGFGIHSGEISSLGYRSPSTS